MTQESKTELKLAIAKENEILRGLVGSEAHGTSIPGQGDRDELGVYVEPKSQALGISTFEQCSYRSVGNFNSPSRPGDLDLTYHSARKFLNHLAKGSPTLLLLLWLPEHLEKTAAGDLLVQNRDLFTTRQTGRHFLGYMGKTYRDMFRDDDLGYHPKSAMHSIRLAIQGRALLETGVMPVPLKQADREFLIAVRQGRFPLDYIKEIYAEVDEDFSKTVENFKDEPDIAAISELLVQVHEAHWDCAPSPANRWVA